jgi:hypothetical protein
MSVSALERRQQNTTQGVSKRGSKATLKRLGHEGRDAAAITPRLYLKLGRTDKFLPILLVYMHRFSFP